MVGMEGRVEARDIVTEEDREGGSGIGGP